MAKVNLQKINKHRSYTIKEIMELLGIVSKTCSRWLEDGLPIISGGKHPILIKGSELKEFLKNRKLKNKISINRNQFLCMTCKAARYAKRGSIKIAGNKRKAQCRVCNGKMSKTFKPYQTDYMIHSPPA